MNVLLTAFIAVAVVGSPDVLPCEGPSDCSAGDVCVAGTCRSGSGKSSVQELYPVAVPPPTLLTADAHVKAVGTRLVEQIRRDLQWSGFYSVLASDSFPSTHQVEGVSPSEVRRLLWQTSGAYRLVRVAVRPSPELGKVHVQVRLIDVEQYSSLSLGGGEITVRAGQDRAIAAACVNELIALDTGLAGVVGSRIATSLEVRSGVKEIGLIGADGKGLTMLTSNNSLNLDPAWDGAGRVGYMSYREGNADWVVDGAVLSGRPGMNAAGAWSHDGKYLAVSVTEGANSDIVILDGSTGTEHIRVTEHPGVDTSPTWSPDGKELAFVSDRTGSPQIWIVTLASGNLRRLTQSGYTTAPDWSPNGHSLVYGQLTGVNFVIKRYDFDTGHTRTLTGSDVSSENATFSPDGRYVAFSRRERDKKPTLWLMNADGTKQRQLTSSANPMFSPAWHRRAPSFKGSKTK